MVSDKKVKLLEVWRHNLFSEFSISEVIKLSKKRTKTWVFNTLKMFVKYNIISSKRKGNLDLYSLDLKNPVSIGLLNYLEAQNNIGFSALEIISDIIDSIPVKEYSLIVFGSYAENKQIKNSDLDICLLISNKETEKKLRPYFNEIKLNYSIKIDEHYITFSEFIQMLLRKEENLGKQIFKKHRLFYNSDMYYQLIKEAYKNGFRP